MSLVSPLHRRRRGELEQLRRGMVGLDRAALRHEFRARGEDRVARGALGALATRLEPAALGANTCPPS